MILRSSLFALAFLVGSIGSVLAHALPGSVLLLRQQGATLQLTVQFPVEDLIIAAPELAALEKMAADQPLPQEFAAALTRYLGRHLSVTEDGVPLTLKMTDARLQAAYHDHLGHFALLVSQWQMTGVRRDATPLVLTYDAVMHEVRNHRATVQWIEQNGDLRPISEFGYFDAADGIPLDPRPVGQQ
ncbi:hypothetical protein CVM52_15075 [Pseudooceanicola lipolyticus]|uniref:Uncharacterized protein n=1 Tax=Pseudooceanicola lipolyticus TaxID=2029104 RepID=A0A2M8IZA3_9RHOB|nr:hypothetical protein [Pseudooceanicola lipolyticus]PJE35847.1 hypothetical protein CVM52_15075 [Pseudooceanicola lipolyticus]